MSPVFSSLHFLAIDLLCWIMVGPIIVAGTHFCATFFDLHWNIKLLYVKGVTSKTPKSNVGSTEMSLKLAALDISEAISLVPITHRSSGMSEWCHEIELSLNSSLKANISPTSLSAKGEHDKSIKCFFDLGRSP